MILQDRKDASEYGYFKYDWELLFDNISLITANDDAGIGQSTIKMSDFVWKELSTVDYPINAATDYWGVY